MSSPPSHHTHSRLLLDISPTDSLSPYTRPPLPRRLAATTPAGRVPPTTPSQDKHDDPSTFPGPIVLPDDCLALEPTYPPQSLRSWLLSKDRNPVTTTRKTLYVVAPPDISGPPAMTAALKSWSGTAPTPAHAKRHASSSGNRHPSIESIREYLSAFYHGLDVKLLDEALRWVSWEEGDFEKKRIPKYIGLATANGQCTGVRCRQPNDPGLGLHHQLNLSDILDVLIELVPGDGYAVLMLVHHDLYEDDEDDFCAGRAFGGSRVAVVSTFRYNPAMDGLRDEVDYEHIWPSSHCLDYLEPRHPQSIISKKSKRTARHSFKSSVIVDLNSPGGIPAAVQAAISIAGTNPSKPDTDGLWLARVCKTASHELGHCFALDHCVYYSCIMQGTASLEEDDRQPPYLCPICLTKLTCAMQRTKPGIDKPAEKEYVLRRYEALEVFCSKRPGVPMLADFGVWLRVRMESLREEEA